MGHHLYILRHAHALQLEKNGIDKERRLSPEGLLQATQLGRLLQNAKHKIDRIIASDAQRTRSTAIQLATEINYPIKEIRFDERLYNCTLDYALEAVKLTPNSVTNLLLVGHYPSVLQLHNYLSGFTKETMMPCEVSMLTFSTGWSDIDEASAGISFNHCP